MLTVVIGGSAVKAWHIGDKKFHIDIEVKKDIENDSENIVSDWDEVIGNLEKTYEFTEEVIPDETFTVKLIQNTRTQLGRGGPVSVDDDISPNGEIEDEWKFTAMVEFKVKDLD